MRLEIWSVTPRYPTLSHATPACPCVERLSYIMADPYSQCRLPRRFDRCSRLLPGETNLPPRRPKALELSENDLFFQIRALYFFDSGEVDRASDMVWARAQSLRASGSHETVPPVAGGKRNRGDGQNVAKKARLTGVGGDGTCQGNEELRRCVPQDQAVTELGQPGLNTQTFTSAAGPSMVDVFTDATISAATNATATTPGIPSSKFAKILRLLAQLPRPVQSKLQRSSKPYSRPPVWAEVRYFGCHCLRSTDSRSLDSLDKNFARRCRTIEPFSRAYTCMTKSLSRIS